MWGNKKGEIRKIVQAHLTKFKDTSIHKKKNIFQFKSHFIN